MINMTKNQITQKMHQRKVLHFYILPYLVIKLIILIIETYLLL